MSRWMKFGLGVAAVAGWLAFALSPKEGGERPDPGPPELDHGALSPIALAGEVITRDPALGLPVAALRVGEHVVVVDRGGGAPLHAVHGGTGEVVSIGRTGEGPGEFEGPWALDWVPGEAAFWVWDIDLQRLTRVALDGELTQGRGRLRDAPTVALRSSAAVTAAVRLASGGWLGLGLFPDGRFGEFDASGRLRGQRGPLPGGRSGVPVQVLQHVYDGPMQAHPDRRLVAVGVGEAGRLEIHDLEADSMWLAEVPFPFEPRFSVVEGSRGPVKASGRDARFAYVDLAVSRDRVYALFSGRTPAGYPERPTFGEYVHVFDWEGGFLGAFRLREAAIGLAVDDSVGALYAVSHDPTPAIWRYELPPESLATLEAREGA